VENKKYVVFSAFAGGNEQVKNGCIALQITDIQLYESLSLAEEHRGRHPNTFIVEIATDACNATQLEG